MSIQVNNRILPGMAMSDDSRIIVMQNQPRTRWYEDASGTRIHEKVKQVSRSAFHATQNFYPTETPTTGRYYTLSMEMETMQPVKNDAK